MAQPQGDPLARPSFDQIMAHPFLQPDGGVRLSDLPKLRPILHFFLSHFQKEANDMVRALCLMLKELGCWCWLDMEAENLTLPGMRQGSPRTQTFRVI